MAGNLYNNKDSIDISELASLNEDISDDLINELQQKLTPQAAALTNNNAPDNLKDNDDSVLFEEPAPPVTDTEQNIQEGQPEESATANTDAEPKESKDENLNQAEAPKKEKLEVNQTFDDNFIKKYKAKLKNKAQTSGKQEDEKSLLDRSSPSGANVESDNADSQTEKTEGDSIEKLTQGNITERKMTKEMKDYNDSLDFLDGNVKYSKYVIYIDPQNVDFIEGLTVKERKNLINSILRQQDDIAITKRRFKVIRTIFIHALVAILVFLASVPVVYYTINASLEAAINNHRNAQSNWQALYKEHGKIPKN